MSYLVADLEDPKCFLQAKSSHASDAGAALPAEPRNLIANHVKVLGAKQLTIATPIACLGPSASHSFYVPGSLSPHFAHLHIRIAQDVRLRWW